MFRVVDLKALQNFERRAWFSSEDPVEQIEVLRFLMRQGMHLKGPLHTIETRRWREFKRDVLNHYKRKSEDLTPFAQSELEGIVSEIVLVNILSPSVLLRASDSLDEKLQFIIAQVDKTISDLDQLETEQLQPDAHREVADLSDEGLWELIVRLYETEGKKD